MGEGALPVPPPPLPLLPSRCPLDKGRLLGGGGSLKPSDFLLGGCPRGECTGEPERELVIKELLPGDSERDGDLPHGGNLRGGGKRERPRKELDEPDLDDVGDNEFLRCRGLLRCH